MCRGLSQVNSVFERMPEKPEKPLPGYSVRAWVSQDDLEKWRKAAEFCETSQADLMTRVLRAGINALEKNNYQFTVPLRFLLGEKRYPNSVPTALELHENKKK